MNEVNSTNAPEGEWEFDDHHERICRDFLAVGEEISWYERDNRFREGSEKVKKTLRRTSDGATFLVLGNVAGRGYEKVLTVGTFSWV